MSHWHRSGERCWCGHLTAPARFYWNGDKELPQEKVEAAYLEWLKEHKPERYKKLAVSRPITRKHKNLAEVEEALRKRERPHTANKRPHVSNVPGRLRGR